MQPCPMGHCWALLPLRVQQADRGHSSLAVPTLPECPVSGALGLALAPPHPSLGVLETGGEQKEKKIACAETHFLVYFVFSFLRERSLQAPSPTKKGPKCHHHSGDWSNYKY